MRECFAGLVAGGPAARQAAARLYEVYAPRFRAFLRMHTLAPEQIEGVVLEVFVRLLGASRRLRKVRFPRAYLWSLLRNAFVDQLHRARRERAGEPQAAQGGTRDWQQELLAGESGRATQRERMEWALEDLQRQELGQAIAIELAAIEGFDGHELACALGRRAGAARRCVTQARRALRARMQPVRGGSDG
jgi:DNA-directed RNA polymerase specialized sigma24 family protein